MTAMLLFGPVHVAVLCITFGLPVALAIIARRSPNRIVGDCIAYALAAALVINKLVGLIAAAARGYLDRTDLLPMQLCDWTLIAAILALIWRWQLAYELTYFWGLGGTLQAVLTPDLARDFPDPSAFTFFISHGGVLAALLYLTLGLRFRPWPRSIARAFVGINVYLAVAAAANLALGTNYGYLCAKPQHPSLMDYLGPWPFYIFSLELLALISFAIYYAPFFLIDLQRRNAFPDGTSPRA